MRIFGLEIGLKNSKKRSNAQTGEVPWLAGRGSDEILGAEDALKVGAVYGCVRVIAETVATLPCILYRRLPGGGKERATDHPLYEILHNAPNLWQDSTQFFEMLTGHAVLRGNAYILFEPSAAGTTLIPLHPARMTVKTSQSGRYKYYEYFDGTKLYQLKPENVVHVFGLSSDGYKGLSPIDLAMRTVNLASKQESYADNMFSNQASPGGILKHPGEIGDEVAKRLKKSFDDRYSGAGNTGKTMLLEEGMEWQQVGLTNEQAQFIEGRKFSRSDIAMWFRMPPHKIGDLERATFSNIEHQALEFVTDTIRPWLVRWEKALMRTLFTPEERKNYVIEFLVDGILRGDIKTRYEAYAIGRNNGWLNADEIREMENRNPLPEGQGKIYIQQVNTQEVGATKKPTEPTKEEAPKEEENSAKIYLKPVLRAILERSLRRKQKILETKEWTDEVREKQKSLFKQDAESVLEALRAKNRAEKWSEMWDSLGVEVVEERLIDEMLEIATSGAE